MRRSGRVVAIIAFNIVAIAVGLELMGVLAYAFRTGRLFYEYSQSGLKATSPDAPRQINQATFHPFFGYIHRVGRHADDWTTNNHGFQFVAKYLKGEDRCCDYPYKKKGNEIIVGIFGGSVADGFALDTQRSGALIRELMKFPQYADKKFRILNFSMPGWMQPHQLLALAYYISLGQRFDIVLELDGFNEVVSIERNWRLGVEPTFPADVLWGAWGRSLEQRSKNYENFDTLAFEYHARLASQWERKQQKCDLAACWLVAFAMERYHRLRAGRSSEGVQAYSQRTSYFPTARMSQFPPNFDIYQFIADRWFDASLEMAELTRAQGGLYLHILQPNQWFKPSGEYEPINPAHPYGFVIKPVNQGYKAMLIRAPELTAKGVPFLDATMVFVGQPAREVYIDDCCHYTLKGNNILAAAVAKALATAKPR